MHTKPMAESEGDFSNERPAQCPCRKCAKSNVTVRTWDSSCGGYEDFKYTCPDCGHYWWIEGADS